MKDIRYLIHENDWWWGRTITLISENGKISVEIAFDKERPNVGFIRNFIVYPTERGKGIGRMALEYCEDIIGKNICKFAELTVDKSKERLISWYNSVGYITISEDSNEYIMLKVL